MAKYRRRPVAVEAEVYHSGLEEGFECYGGCYACNMKHCDRCNKYRPYIDTLDGRRYIYPGDYIVADEYGSRTLHSPDEFHRIFEEAL